CCACSTSATSGVSSITWSRICVLPPTPQHKADFSLNLGVSDFGHDDLRGINSRNCARARGSNLRPAAALTANSNMCQNPQGRLLAGSERVGPHLAGAHAHSPFEVEHEHLAVADTAGPCGILDCLYHAVG